MNSLSTWQAINPSPDEIHAVCAAFGDLPKMEILPRLVMIRRAVAAGFYTDELRHPHRRTNGPPASIQPDSRTRLGFS